MPFRSSRETEADMMPTPSEVGDLSQSKGGGVTSSSHKGPRGGEREDRGEDFRIAAKTTIFSRAPVLLRAVRFKATIFAVLVFCLGTVHFGVNLSGYIDEFDTRFKNTNRIFLDSLQLWLAICGLLMMIVSSAQLLATCIKGDSVSHLFLLATYAQSSVSVLAMSLLDSLDSGAQFLLVISPIIGTIMEIDVRVLVIIWGFGVFAYLFHTVNTHYATILVFPAPERPIASAASYVSASVGLLVIPQLLYHFSKHEQARMAACETFTSEVCGLLTDLNVQGARRRIEEEQARVRNGVPHTSTPVIHAVSKLVQNLANFRSYVPAAVLTDEFEESDVSDMEDSHTDKGGSMIGGEASASVISGVDRRDESLGPQQGGAIASRLAVEKSQFRKRWSTVMYVEIFANIGDTAKADYISSRVPEAVIPHVMAHRGVFDVLSPTVVLVTFNCHIPCVIHESEACACALAVAADLSARIPDINFSISIASGYNFIGSFGNDQHRARVVVGESMRLAMKIPTIMKRHLGSRIIVSEDTASKVGYELAPIDNIAPVIKGVGDRVVTIYELRSSRKENTPAPLLALYNGAFSFLREGDFARALDMWHQYLECNPEDLQAQRLQAVCEVKAKTMLRDSSEAVLEPYSRKELLWESFDGEYPVLKKIYQRYRAQSAAAIEGRRAGGGRAAEGFGTGGDYNSSMGSVNPSTAQQDGGGGGGAVGYSTRDIGEAVRQQFLSTQRMEYQEDGLVPMFVIADSDDDAADGDSQNHQSPSLLEDDEASRLNNGPFHTGNPNDALSSAVPRNFEDSYHNKWQRSDNIVGVGAFSQVYLALGEQGNLVAMKCFILANRLTRKEELVTEVETLSSLRNDYIVGYVSYAITPNHFIILMEYVSGGSLYQLIDQFGPLPAPAARRYLIDVLKGLRYLHENNTTHCDIKPHNVLLSNDGTCKLSDFGSSVSAISQQSPDAALDQELVKGTSWYLAPEAARGDIRTANDIWSIGVTLLEVLTGKQPWEYAGGEANFIIKLGKDPAMIPTIPSSIQGEVRRFIECCLERDPDRRPTVHQLLLHAFLIG